MDEERGDSKEEEGVTEARRGGSEVERGLRSETGSWFQRQGEADRKERSATRIDDDVGGRVTVMR